MKRILAVLTLSTLLAVGIAGPSLADDATEPTPTAVEAVAVPEPVSEPVEAPEVVVETPEVVVDAVVPEEIPVAVAQVAPAPQEAAVTSVTTEKSQSVTVWRTWLVPAGTVPIPTNDGRALNGLSIPDSGFPQNKVGDGQIAAAPGTCVQQDQYKGKQKDINALGDVLYKGEDWDLVQKWYIDCAPPTVVANLAFGSITRAETCGAVDVIGDLSFYHSSLVGTLDRSVGTHTATFVADDGALFPIAQDWSEGGLSGHTSEDGTTLTITYTVGQNEACPTNECVAGQGDTSTDLNDLWSTIDVRANGHVEYVSGGLHVWTDGTGYITSPDSRKVSEGRAANFALANTGVIGLNWTGTTPPPGVNLFVNFGNGKNGTLVYESVYGQDLWLTQSGINAGIAAPVVGGGNGTTHHGTIDQWLTLYPNAQVTGIAYSLGSGVTGDGVIKSITVNCTTYLFDKVAKPTVTPPLVEDTFTEWVGSPKCGESSFEQTRTKTTTTTTYRVEVVNGAYVNVPNEPTVATTTETRTVRVDATPCPTTTPTPTPSVSTPEPSPSASETPVVTAAPETPSLAHTGSNAFALGGLGIILIAAGAAFVIARRRTARA